MSTAPGTKSDYLLLFRNTELEPRLSPAEIREAMERLDAWLTEWSNRGNLKGGQPLGSQARLISGAKQRMVADGPFAESKEVVGGYVMVSAADFEEASRIAQEWPLLDYDCSVEVRPLVEMCPYLAQWREENAALAV